MILIKEYSNIDYKNNSSSFNYLKQLIIRFQNNQYQLTLVLESFNQALSENELQVFIGKHNLNKEEQENQLLIKIKELENKNTQLQHEKEELITQLEHAKNKQEVK